ncbi:phage tail assembly protein [Maridesulfovibrio ferrireducens]|uniref:phage tail assembly protein n=1 Tax=Maridesulfovibrio ferrireducens TaxID=246191 RepID=UPI001A23A841|nr:phage tail assembly protein [Maridesulfovibrio ferrireducens]MBI9112248.1 phage tail assembly protein [Maridesulfovibrio ferrireducens]
MARLETVKINFDYPVTVGDNEVEFVTMRRQKVQDSIDAEVMASTKTGAEMEACLFSLTCGIPVEDLLTWDHVDYLKLQEKYVFLMTTSSEKIVHPSEEESSVSPAGQDGAEKK